MNQNLSFRDQKYIWHPYTQHKNMVFPVPVERAERTILFGADGRQYIDAVSSWWVTVHGHGHPYIAKKIYEQALKLEQVIFTGFTHEPAVRLAERLLPMLPGNFSKLFYSDNGSTATEVAIKMALQFWWNLLGQPEKTTERNRILAFKDAYHGDTFGAMSVSGRSIFTRPFRDQLFDVEVIDLPDASNINQLTAFLRENGKKIAGFIFEPLVQGAGGMRMYQAEYMNWLLQVCREEKIICIADEVMTGFGRTGTMFACEQLDVKPDIICLSKGITGGVMALGATACSEEIYEAFLHDDKLRTFFHGHSFTANPMACAASLASLDLFEEEKTLESISRIQKRNTAFAQQLKQLEDTALTISNIRVQGTILAFDVEVDDVRGYLNHLGAVITAAAMKEGVYLRPLGNTVYILPPYCITDEELDKVFQTILKIVVEGV
ncbi:MAG TPA: adenosylmethionine--8-amino-7-oxononanoate transaminase [Parasegetibacter sp.]